MYRNRNTNTNSSTYTGRGGAGRGGAGRGGRRGTTYGYGPPPTPGGNGAPSTAYTGGQPPPPGRNGTTYVYGPSPAAPGPGYTTTFPPAPVSTVAGNAMYSGNGLIHSGNSMRPPMLGAPGPSSHSTTPVGTPPYPSPYLSPAVPHPNIVTVEPRPLVAAPPPPPPSWSSIAGRNAPPPAAPPALRPPPSRPAPSGTPRLPQTLQRPSTHFLERASERGIPVPEAHAAFRDPNARITYRDGAFKYQGTNGVTLVVSRDGDMITTYRT